MKKVNQPYYCGNMNYTLNLLKSTLSGGDSLYSEFAFISTDWKEHFDFFCNHAIAPLVSGLNQYVQDDNIKKVWKESVYSNIYTYSSLVKKQKQILDAFKVKNIQVVVVKCELPA